MTPVAPIAVVIPAFNRAGTLPRTLASLAGQTVSPAQVILVDNNSTDESAAIMARWADDYRAAHPDTEVMLLAERKPGACPARNRGLAAVTAPFVMFFDSDDEMLPAHIADFAAAIAAEPEADIFGRDITARFLDGTERRLYCTISPDSVDTTLFHHIFGGSLSTQRIVVRTALVRAVGGWDETLAGWNDFELGVRLLLSRPRLARVPGELTVITYQQEQSITGTLFSLHPERWETSLTKIRTLVASAPALGRRATRWVDARAAVLAAQYHAEAPLHPEASRLARSLLLRTLALTDAPRRIRFIYRYQRLIGRFARIPARLLL